MDSNYPSLCTNTIQKFIADSTRLDHGEVDAQLIDSFDFDYQILLNITLGIHVHNQTFYGRASNTKNQSIFDSRNRYEEALKEHSAQALQRQETLQEIFAVVSNHPYGHIAKNTPFYDYPLGLGYVYECSNCHGNGNIKCSNCGGSGKKTCSHCHGNGQTMKTRTRYDSFSGQNRTEHYYENCSNCWGSGKVRCSSCGGSGKQTCPECKGTGCLTCVSQIQVMAQPQYELILPQSEVPDYVPNAFYKAGLPSLGNYGSVTELQGNILPEKRSIAFTYKATTPFARLQSTIKETHVNWILYGQTPHIFDAGHALEIILESDLNALKKSAMAGKRKNPFLAFASKKSLRDFMFSEAHQNMLILNTQGKNGEQLREHLHRAFSQPYIDDALQTLTKLVNAINWWSFIKWLLFAVFCAYGYIAISQILVLPPTNAVSNKTIYLSYLASDFPQASFQGHLWTIFKTYFFKIMAALLCVLLIAHPWRLLFFRRAGGKSLSVWGKNKRLIKSHWILHLVLGTSLCLLVLYALPIKVENNQLFNLIPIEKIISSINYIKSWIS